MADISLIIDTNADKVTSEFNRLGNTVLSQVKKAQQLERGYKDLDRAFNKGQISAQKYSRGILQVDKAIKQALTGQAQLAAATNRTAGAMNTMSAAQNVSTRRMGRGSVITQQAGYQVGDFLVQIQGGTNAFVAFGQQATQVAGTLTILGGKWVLIGTILGVVIPLTTALGAAMARTNTDTSFLADSLETISPLLDTMASAANYVKETFLDMANALVNNLDRIISYGITLSALFAGKLVGAFIAARVATMSLAGSLVFLRGALIRTGIGALVVGAGELVFQFIRLVKAAGGFGAAMGALRDVTAEAFNNMYISGQRFVLNLNLAFNDLAHAWVQKVGDMKFAWGSFVDYLASFEPLGNFGLGLSGGNAAAAAAEQASAMKAQTDQMIVLMDAIKKLDADSGESTESLQKLKDLMDSISSGSDIDVRDWDLFGGSDDKDKDKSGDRASKLEAFIASLQTERETLESWYGEQQELLTTFNESELAAIGGHAEAKLRIEEEYLKRKSDLLKNSSDFERNMVMDSGISILNALGQFNDKALKMAQVASAAKALINTYEGASEALKLPFPYNLAAASSVVAAGLGFVASIKNPSSGGGGRGGGGGFSGGVTGGSTPKGAEASVPTPSAPKDQRVLIKGLGPKDLLTGEMLQELFDKLYDENQERGAVFMVST